jgi:hypothetical protein
MADRWQGEATKSVRSWGFNSYKPPDAREYKWDPKKKTLVLPDEPGKPDMMVWRGGRMGVIEVKDGYDAFPFANFEENKRDYAAKWCMAAPYWIQYWVWLCLGVGQPQWPAEKQPRRTWLIPLQEFYAVEELLKPHQLSIPYFAGKGRLRILQDNQWDAIHLFQEFEVQWNKNGFWRLPTKHPFYRLYVEPEPLPMYERERKAG